MIILKMTMNALPDKGEEIRQTLISMYDGVRNETGCIAYRMFRNIRNQSSFSSFGEWSTRSSLLRHLKSDNFSVMLGMNCMLITPMQIRIMTVKRSEGAELVKAMRKSCLPLAISDEKEGDFRNEQQD